MSGSFTTPLRYGALCGWRLTIRYHTTAGQLWHASTILEAPARRDQPILRGGMAFAPGVDGFELVHDLFVNAGGHDRARALADHLIAEMRDAVTHRYADLGIHGPVWQRLIDAADHAQAEYYARTGADSDNWPGLFEVVGRLVYDRRTDRLVTA